MRVYRASRHDPMTFDPLDSAPSIRGSLGWRFNDTKTEILYAAEVESLAILEVAIRPGLHVINQIVVATIEIPDDAVVEPRDLKIILPSNWNARPAANDSRAVARQFLDAIASMPKTRRPVGLRVPSVLSGSDHNVLLDPSQKARYRASISHLMPFRTLSGIST